MLWLKKGIILEPNTELWWQQKYAILPTPIHLEKEGIIRVFYASTCQQNIGRISFVDLNDKNPSDILYKHIDFIAGEGPEGSFDENGINPSSIVFFNNKWLLFYAGYQRHHKTPYSIFSGVLVSDDCKNFTRIRNIPVLERLNDELSLRSAPTIKFSEDKLLMWYVADKGWDIMEGSIFGKKKMPQYSIKYGESKDGINWNTKPEYILQLKPNEFGIGRPFIHVNGSDYLLFYSLRTKNKTYRIGYAESEDAINWTRKDEEIGIDVSESGWDSEMICYPAVLTAHNKTYLFYNGNNNGATGFGYAELIER